MTTFEFNNSEGTYAKRTRESLIRNVTISTVVGLVVGLLNDWTWGVIIAVFFFVVQYFKSERWDKIFINKITFDDNNLKIDYTDQDTAMSLDGKINDFLLKKEIAFNRTKTVYLAVYYADSLKLKQFEIGDWSENKMNEVINAKDTCKKEEA